MSTQKDKCRVQSKQESMDWKTVLAYYKVDINDAFETTFPKPDASLKKANLYYRKLEKLLKNYAWDYGTKNFNGRIQNIGHFYKIDRLPTFKTKFKNTLAFKIIGGTMDYMTNSLKIILPQQWARDEKAYIAAYNYLNEIIQKKEKNFRENRWNTSLLPKEEVLFWYPGYELIADIVRQGNNLDAITVTARSETINRLEEIHKKLRNSLYGKGGKINLNNLLLGNVKKFFVDTKMVEDEVEVLDFIYNDSNTILTGIKVKNIHPSKKDEPPYIVKKERISLHEKETLLDRLEEQSLIPFIDDIMHGQIQYRIPTDKASPLHLKQIKQMMRFDKLTYENAQKKNKEMKDAGISVKELEGSSKFVQFMNAEHNGKFYEINYVVIKNGEMNTGTEKETYNVYIIKHKEKGTESKNTVMYYGTDKNGVFGEWHKKKQLKWSDLKGDAITKGTETYLPDLMQEGYYRASSMKQYGESFNKYGRPIAGSAQKGFTNFTRLTEQQSPIKKVEDAIWTAINDSDIGLRKKTILEKLSDDLGGNLKEKSDIPPNPIDIGAVNDFKSAINEEIDKIDKFLQVIHLNQDSYVDDTGIHFPIDKTFKMDENYSKTSYSKAQRHEFVLQKIRAIEDYGGYKEDEDNNSDLFNADTTIKQFKHILPTDKTLRDKSLVKKYTELNKEFAEIERMKYGVSVLEGIHNLLQYQADKVLPVDGKYSPEMFKTFDLIEEFVRHARMVVKDPTVNSSIFGFLPTSYSAAAKVLNTFSIKKNWDEDSARIALNQMRAFFTQKWLRMSTAIPNRGQSYLPSFQIGLQHIQDARTALDPIHSKGIHGLSPQECEDICAYGGSGNTMKVFMDMLSNTSLRMRTFDGASISNFIPFFKKIVPNIPTRNMWQYGKIMLLSREDFIKTFAADYKQTWSRFVFGSKIKKREKTLKKLLKKGKLIQGTLEYRLARAQSFTEEEKYRAVATAVHNILHMSKEEKTRRNVEKELQNALIDTQDNLMKKFVTWSLSFHWNEDLGDIVGITTFTQSELMNHKITYLAALFAADELGLLGKWDKNGTLTDKDGNLKNDISRFKSAIAVKIGSDADRIFQFTTSMAASGELFWNAGATIAHLKQFLTKREFVQQRMHKWAKLGSKGQGLFDYPKRMTKAQIELIKNIGKKFEFGKVGVDNAARARVLSNNIAIISTSFSIAMYQLGMFNFLRKNQSIIKASRGFEAPFTAMFINIMVNMIKMLLVDDDDRDGEKKKISLFLSIPKYLFQLLFPAALMYMIQRGFSYYEAYNEITDDNSRKSRKRKR